jgi:hypothetical protein
VVAVAAALGRTEGQRTGALRAVPPRAKQRLLLIVVARDPAVPADEQASGPSTLIETTRGRITMREALSPEQLAAVVAELVARCLREQQVKTDARFAELEAKNEALTRASERRSEQRAKMPPPPKPPRTPEEVAEHRRKQAELRADNVVVTEQTISAPHRT